MRLQGSDAINTAEFFKGKKVVVVGVVGAFTSVCDGQVPAFASSIDAFKSKGMLLLYGAATCMSSWVTVEWQMYCRRRRCRNRDCERPCRGWSVEEEPGD